MIWLMNGLSGVGNMSKTCSHHPSKKVISSPTQILLKSFEGDVYTNKRHLPTSGYDHIVGV